MWYLSLHASLASLAVMCLTPTFGTAIRALDPEPTVPGLSPDDLLTLYWTQATNRPDVGTMAAIGALLTFSPPLATILRASWQPGGDDVPGAVERLVITLSGSVNEDIAATLVPVIRLSVLRSGGLRDVGNTCTNASIVDASVTGTWGNASQPQFASWYPVVALDYGGQPGLGVGDAILIRFNQAVFPVPAHNTAAVDALLEFTPPQWATGYMGTWMSSTALLITVTDVPSATQTDPPVPSRTATDVGSLRVTVRPLGGLTSLDRTAAPSNASSLVTDGSWGDVVCDGSLHVYSHTSVVVVFLPPVGPRGFTPVNFTVVVSKSSSFARNTTNLTLSVATNQSVSFLELPPGLPAASLGYVVSGLEPGVPVYAQVAASVPVLPLEVARVLPFAVTPVLWAIGGSEGCQCAALKTTTGCNSSGGLPLALAPALPSISMS